MEILDETVKGAKVAFDKASDFAGKAVNAGKLKAEEVSLSLKLKGDYEKLGRIAYEIFKDEKNDVSVKIICGNIGDKIERIEELKKQIKAIKEKSED